MNFFDQGDLRLKGIVMEVNESHSKFEQVLEMVGVMPQRVQAWFFLNTLFLATGVVGSSTTGMFLFESMAYRCA